MGRFPKTRERRSSRIRARAAEGIMADKAQDAEFRHPDAALVEGGQRPARRQMLARKQELGRLP